MLDHNMTYIHFVPICMYYSTISTYYLNDTYNKFVYCSRYTFKIIFEVIYTVLELRTKNIEVYISILYLYYTMYIIHVPLVAQLEQHMTVVLYMYYLCT